MFGHDLHLTEMVRTPLPVLCSVLHCALLMFLLYYKSKLDYIYYYVPRPSENALVINSTPLIQSWSTLSHPTGVQKCFEPIMWPMLLSSIVVVLGTSAWMERHVVPFRIML